MTTLITQGDSGGTTGRCDARCHTATSSRCHCVCGGRYHGCAKDGQRPPGSIEEAEALRQGVDLASLTDPERAAIRQTALRGLGWSEDAAARVQAWVTNGEAPPKGRSA